MNQDKHDYWKGLQFFVCSVICMCLFFTTPDGDSLFYKLLGVFGISPGIRLGSGTLYIYMFIPIIAVVVCIKKVFRYWQGYGERFKGYHFFLRYLPLFIIVPVLLFPSSIMSPTGLDRLYYAVLGQHGGLKAVTYYSESNSNLKYEFAENHITYYYDLTFDNHSGETVEFNVKFMPKYHETFEEFYVKDDSGEVKVFTLLPNMARNFKGEFTEFYQNSYSSGSGGGSYSIVLTADNEEFSPKPITKPQRRGM